MTLSRRSVLMSLTLAGVVGTPSLGVAQTNFTQEAFRAAQAAGQPILVEVHADWCPVCVRQKPILGALAADPAFASLTRFLVDFDTQKDVVQHLRVTRQSTLIVYRGATERGRSIGDTDAASIRALVTRALA